MNCDFFVLNYMFIFRENFILLHFLWGCGKIVQNGQTEQKQGFALLLVTRRRMFIRREAKFVHSIKHFLKKVVK